MDYSEQLRKMNQANREFWAREAPLLPPRIADEALRTIILSMQSDEQKRLPVALQKSLQALSDDANTFKHIILRQQGRKGGSVKRVDALQRAILQIVHKQPGITSTGLEALLTRDRFPDLIVETDDGLIHFIEPDGSEDGRPKKTKISALKYRLSRAKRTLRSP